MAVGDWELDEVDEFPFPVLPFVGLLDELDSLAELLEPDGFGFVAELLLPLELLSSWELLDVFVPDEPCELELLPVLLDGLELELWLSVESDELELLVVLPFVLEDALDVESFCNELDSLVSLADESEDDGLLVCPVVPDCPVASVLSFPFISALADAVVSLLLFALGSAATVVEAASSCLIVCISPLRPSIVSRYVPCCDFNCT